MAGVGSHAARIGLVRFAGEVPYAPALALQDAIASSVKKGSLPSLLISLQHKPCFTLGKRGKLDDVLARDQEAKCDGVEVVRSNRGGEVTYHGPGQVVVYPIVNLRAIKFGPRKYVETLEDAVVDTVAEMGLSARGRVPGATGVWIEDRKVAAIGVRISGGVATHGVALNVDPDLSKFRDIVPCGITDKEVTSVWRELGGRGPTAEETGDRLLRRLAALLGSPGGGFSPLSPPEMGEVEGFARRVAPGASFSVE